MKIIIKYYHRSDLEQFKKLVDLSFEQEYLLNILSKSRYKFAYSAFTHEKLVGVAFGWGVALIHIVLTLEL